MRSCSARAAGRESSHTRDETACNLWRRADGRCNLTTRATPSLFWRLIMTSPSASELSKKFANSTQNLNKGSLNPDSAVENQGKETWDGTRSGMGVMILSGWLGVWSVRDHSNCAAIGSPSDTVRKRRKNSGRSG